MARVGMPSRRVASTGWITDPVIPFDDLRKADLGEVWVAQDVEGTTADAFAMTDGRTYVWAYRHDDGHATYQVYAEHANEQPGENPVRDAVEEAFQVEWVSEHQDEFWSEEERAEQDAQAEQDEAEDWEPDGGGGEGPKGSSTVHSDLSSRTPLLRMAARVAAPRTADVTDMASLELSIRTFAREAGSAAATAEEQADALKHSSGFHNQSAYPHGSVRAAWGAAREAAGLLVEARQKAEEALASMDAGGGALASSAARVADAYSPFHDAPGEGGPGLLERLEEWLREAEGDLEVIAMASQTVEEARRAFERADLPPTEWDASLADVHPDLSATYEFRDHGDGGWNVDVALSHGGTEVATVPMVEAGTGREALLGEALSAAGL